MLYPVFLDVRGRKCVVIGGGKVAARKVAELLEAGAMVTVVSPKLLPELARLARCGTIEWKEGGYRKTVLRGAFLAIAATDDEKINRRVRDDGREAGALVNVVDVPELCDFQMPAVIRRGGIVIAIGTGGGSPALSRRIRENLEAAVGPEYGELLEIMGGWRDTVKAGVSAQPLRKEIWDEILDSGALAQLAAGKPAEARETVARIVRKKIDEPAAADKSAEKKRRSRKTF